MIRKAQLIICLLLLLHFSGFAQLSEMEQLKISITKITDSAKYVDALNRLGTLMYEKNLDSSFTLSRKAREIASRLRYDQGKADALTNLGAYFYYKENMQMGIRYYNEALVLYKKIKDSANVVQSMMNIGNVYVDLPKKERAQEWYDKAMKMGEKLSRDSIMALLTWNYMFAYPEKFNEKERQTNIDKIKKIALKYKDKRMQFLVEKFIADDLFKKGERKKALEHLSNIADSASKYYYLFSAEHFFIDLGDRLITDDPLLAAKKYKKGLAIAEKNGLLYFSIYFSKKLFHLYNQLGDDHQAKAYADKSISLYEMQNDQRNLSNIDYLDYALKEEQVSSLVLRSQYQTTLLIVVTIVCLLIGVILTVVRQNLHRTKKFNLEISSQNDKLKNALQALEQSQADNTRMLKVVAHDLRSPITGIYSLSSLLMDDNCGSYGSKEMLRMIKDSSEDSLKLINEVLQVQFKIETFDKVPVKLAELLQRCVFLLRNSADAKAQTINLHLQQITILASGEKLWRVMSNLIANAIKFSPNEAIIEVRLEKGTNYVRICVADEGIGIPVEIEDKIFEMFTEAKRQGTAGEQPFGLGLAISKQIVEAHGGKIWFERKADKGTSFLIEFPLSES